MSTLGNSGPQYRVPPNVCLFLPIIRRQISSIGEGRPKTMRPDKDSFFGHTTHPPIQTPSPPPTVYPSCIMVQGRLIERRRWTQAFVASHAAILIPHYTAPPCAPPTWQRRDKVSHQQNFGVLTLCGPAKFGGHDRRGGIMHQSCRARSRARSQILA